MTKTHAEFLEELKEFVSDFKWLDEFGMEVIYANKIVEKIEKFESEQKQVSDENI